MAGLTMPFMLYGDDDDWYKANHAKSPYARPRLRLSKEVLEEHTSGGTHHGFRKRHQPPGAGDGDGNTKRATPSSQAKSEDEAFAIGRKLMMMMGYEPGKGLGTDLQGRASNVEAVQRDDRIGLGFTKEYLEKRSLPDEEAPMYDFPEKIKWIRRDDDADMRRSHVHHNGMIMSVPDYLELPDADLKKGCVKASTDVLDVKYGDAPLVNSLYATKDVFDRMTHNDFVKARNASNPFETIKSGPFMNRAALKLVNIDHCCAILPQRTARGSSIKCNITGPTNGPLLDHTTPMSFLDVCAAPGGFSEYMLWKLRLFDSVKGFGITRRGDGGFDWAVEKFNPDALACNFHQLWGADGSGNIYHQSNILDLRESVHKHFPNGVNFVTADGGFDVDTLENEQERMHLQLMLCQFICMFMNLAPGGNFVCKLYDTFTSFMAELLFMVYCSFDEFTIIKPVSSRPANSEKYVVAKGYHPISKNVLEHLLYVNDEFNVIRVEYNKQKVLKTPEDHIEASGLNSMFVKAGTEVPIKTEDDNAERDAMKALVDDMPKEIFVHLVDENLLTPLFTSYLTEMNMVLAFRQYYYTRRVVTFYQDPSLFERNQAGSNGTTHKQHQEMCRRHCLNEWKLNDEKRSSVILPQKPAEPDTRQPVSIRELTATKAPTEVKPEIKKSEQDKHAGISSNWGKQKATSTTTPKLPPGKLSKTAKKP